MDVQAGLLAAVLFMSLFIERAVEQFVAPIAPGKVLPYVALGIGVALAAAFGLDLVTPGLEAAGVEPLVGWAGVLVTGVALGGGGSFIHDLWPGSGTATHGKPSV